MMMILKLAKIETVYNEYCGYMQFFCFFILLCMFQIYNKHQKSF